MPSGKIFPQDFMISQKDGATSTRLVKEPYNSLSVINDERIQTFKTEKNIFRDEIWLTFLSLKTTKNGLYLFINTVEIFALQICLTPPKPE